MDETRALQTVYACVSDTDRDEEVHIEGQSRRQSIYIADPKQHVPNGGLNDTAQTAQITSTFADHAELVASPTEPWLSPTIDHTASSQLEDHTNEDYDATVEDSYIEVTPAIGSYGHDASQSVTISRTVSQLLPQLYLEKSALPLTDMGEAMLFRYYCTHLARNSDILDPQRHFRTVVPLRAATCPILLNAIFALSARHLSRIGQFNPLISNAYYQACLQRLIPLLSDSASEAILDENLLAAHVILRHLEELEVPLTGFSPSNDGPTHLLGSHIFITAQERAVDSGGLREAAFWVGLRQDIYVAFVNQSAAIPTLEYCNISRTCEPDAPDQIWSRIMVALCAQIICYCFAGDDQDGAVWQTSTYTSLARSVAWWYESKPDSFTPIYYMAASADEVFPQLWFASDEVVVGLQHYHLAKILLSAHDPSIPRLGPRGTIALREVDHDIREQVRALCGICTSNTDTAPNFAYASMAITMAGDKFTSIQDQEAMLEILETTDHQHGWPTDRARDALKVAWGWTSNV